MKKRIISSITALALCLSLCAPWALAAEGAPAVTINDVALEDGKTYVAAEDGGVAAEDGEIAADTPYLDYNSGTLTVCGAFEVDGTMTVNADLTITGGEGSSLNVNAPSGEAAVELGGGSTLTLDGGVDINLTAARDIPAIDSYDLTGTFNTTNNYSGNIVVDGEGQAVSGTGLNVQSSGSITFAGSINACVAPDAGSAEPVVLNSAGDISFQSITCLKGDGPNSSPTSVKIKGANVEIVTDVYPCVNGVDFLEIEATGDVTISSSAPLGDPDGTTSNLSVKNAQNVSITGNSDTRTPFLCTPVTFENCGNITVTDNGSGEFMAEDVTVTSDCPWTAATGEKSATVPAGSWTDGGDIENTWNTGRYMINSTFPIVYKAGEGRIFYEPAAEGAAAVLTLDDAFFEEDLFISSGQSSGARVPLRLELKGENQMQIYTSAPLTLTGTGSFAGKLLVFGGFTNNSTGALNAVVGETETDVYRYTVYGEQCTSNYKFNVTATISLTIAEGAVLTVDTVKGLTITDPAGLTNNGTIINNSEITIIADENATDAAVSALIESLKLTGTGVVSVTKGGTTDTYSNDGVKLLAPTGDLDLRSAGTEDTANWDAKGYKWEDVKTDTSGNIISGTLTLADGFNATKVTLPDAAVTIVTEGRSRIGELAPVGGSGPQKTALTFSGAGLLTVDKRMEFSGGNNNSVTVGVGAEVVASSGISIGASGVDGVVTVNGALTAAQGGESGCAILAGKVAVGDTGVLEISGECGVQLCGVTDAYSGEVRFEDLFTVTGGGRFTADCSEYNVVVQAAGSSLPDGTTAEGAIPLGEEFLPADCEQKLDGSTIHLVKTGTGEIYTGRITIHRNHTWNEDVWASDAATHWRPCVFEGCDKRDSEAAHTPGEDYASDSGGHWQRCTVCGSETGRTAHSAAGEYGHNETNHWETCVCGRKLDSEEAHTLGEDYRFDSDGHWQMCMVCGYKTGRAAHIYDDGRDTECNDCGYVRTINPGDSGGSSSGGSAPSTYPVKIEKTEHGKISASPSDASSGTRITLTVTPDEGYVTSALTVTDRSGKTIVLTQAGGGKYTFVMPSGSVSVRAEFDRIAGGSEACLRDSSCPIWPFTDADTTAWYHDGVHYCLENGLMSGFGDGTFGPGKPITRAQLVQILHNREGRPLVNYLMQFEDAPGGAWYAEAVRWAASEGVVFGYSSYKFGPDDNITREQLAVMLWRFAGSPAATGGLAFTDADAVRDYALEAMRWATENGIINGRGSGILDPQGNATRAEAAAMLMRVLSK